MEIAASVVVDCHIEDVFDYVSDPANDQAWCAKVLSVTQVAGDGPGPGALWMVVHRPLALRPARRMAYACVAWEPPVRIAWRAEDGVDELDIAYELEPVWTATRLTQRDDARLGAPPPLRPLVARGIRRDMRRQLQALKVVLERGAPHAR